MQTTDIMHEIQRLSLDKKFYVVEETLKSIRKDEMNHQMEIAVEELYNDYNNDKELTAFTALDLEHFYETKWNLAIRPWPNQRGRTTEEKARSDCKRWQAWQTAFKDCSSHYRLERSVRNSAMDGKDRTYSNQWPDKNFCCWLFSNQVTFPGKANQ